MPQNDRDCEQTVRERAYFIWESEGRPESRADDHLRLASIENLGAERVRYDGSMDDEEKILAGRPDANIPALLAKDVRGG
jgi:hypothetical protein